MKVRIKFSRTGPVKFLGHLDLMRYFQKAIRRADIDIKYTGGFSPHQVMSFAAPLGVGIESEGEYFDIEVNSTPEENEAVLKLNKVMAQGIRIIEYHIIDDKAEKAMAAVAAAEYDISPRERTGRYGFKEFSSHRILPELKSLVEKYIASPDEIPFKKKTKKSERIIDLKPLIYEAEVLDKSENSIRMLLSAGSAENLKPQLVLEYLYGCVGVEYDPLAYRIIRRDVYRLREGIETGRKREDFIPLGEDVTS